MTSPHFRRKPGRNDPVSKEELQRRCDNWARMCSQLDDYAIAGNIRGIERVLTRLHGSIDEVQRRYGVNGYEPQPRDLAAEARAWESRVTKGMP